MATATAVRSKSLVDADEVIQAIDEQLAALSNIVAEQALGNVRKKVVKLKQETQKGQ